MATTFTGMWVVRRLHPLYKFQVLTRAVHAGQAIVRFSSLQETDVITFSSLVSSLFLCSADTFFEGITISCASLFYWWLKLYSCDSQVKDFQLPSLVSQLALNQFKSIESAKVHHLNSSHWWSDLSHHHSLKISPFLSVISCVHNLDLTLLLRYKFLWVWVHLPLGSLNFGVFHLLALTFLLLLIINVLIRIQGNSLNSVFAQYWARKQAHSYTKLFTSLNHCVWQ